MFNTTAPPRPDPPRTHLEDSFPSAGLWLDVLTQGSERTSWWAANAQQHSFDWGLWTLADTLVSFLGWTFFGSAWAGLFQGCVLLGCRVVAHYIWAVCWPIVSLVCAVVMTLVWLARRVLRLLGTCVFFAQKWLGGTPEEAADYYGPELDKCLRPPS